MNEKNYTPEEVAEQIKTLMRFAVTIPEEALKDTIKHIDNLVSGSIVFEAMGKRIDFDECSRNKKRATAMLNFIKIIKETNVKEKNAR